MTIRRVTGLASGMANEPYDRRRRSTSSAVASLKMRALAAGFLIGIAASAAVWAYYFQEERSQLSR
jgi:hypothetical protein